MRIHQLDIRQWIAGRTAKLMFSLSLVFLFCQAVLVVLWADVPMLIENARSLEPDQATAAVLDSSLVQSSFQTLTLAVMMLIWPIIIAESVFHWLSRSWDSETRKYHFFGLLFCICPSLRMCARSPEMGNRLWLPGLGWRTANKRLRARLERHFSIPMIMIALLIMPVLIVEFFMKTQVARYDWLRLSLHVSTGVIWFAFAGEFILMFSIAEKKLDYCKKHWIDLAIILLPFISFLRSLRVLRASRAAKLVRISQLSKFARMYRLRGTALKTLRALILLDLVQRMMGGPERSIERLQNRLQEVESEAKELRRKINRLQRKQRQQQAEQSSGQFNDLPPSEPADLPIGERQAESESDIESNPHFKSTVPK